MVLYFVGLGLYDEHDITLRGLEVIKRCKRVFLEAYTSILMVDKERLEVLYERSVEVADRQMVESEAHKILDDALDSDVAFCVVGDPFGATTHTDLQLRARERGIRVQIIHNASIMNAIGSCGLQLYRFGQTISVVFFTETWRPDSFYDKIAQNRKLGLHTLCLLDIKVKEPSLEGLARGKLIYEAPRYMSINTCIEQLLEVEDNRQEQVYSRDTLCIGVSRLGSEDQQIVAGTMEQLSGVDFGAPLHSMVLCGTFDDFEQQMFELHKVSV